MQFSESVVKVKHLFLFTVTTVNAAYIIIFETEEYNKIQLPTLQSFSSYEHLNRGLTLSFRT